MPAIEYEDRTKLPKIKIEDWSQDELDGPRIPRPPEKEIKRLPRRRPEIGTPQPRLYKELDDPFEIEQEEERRRKKPGSDEVHRGPSIFKL